VLYILGDAACSLSLIVAVALIGFLLTAGYSATGVRPSASPLEGGNLTGTNTVVLRSNLTISNPGLYPLSGLLVQAQVRLGGPDGALVATGTSAPATVSGRAVAEVPFSVTVPLGSGVAASLLTQDAQLSAQFWANATYAALFDVHLVLPENLSWGAPFDDLSVHVGAPTAQPDGLLAFPVSVSFDNHASFPIDGQVDYTLQSASGAACGSGNVTVDAPAGSAFQQGSTASVPQSCNPRGGTLVLGFTGPSWALPLPSEAIP
jgi:hypothetical protein